MAGMNEEYGGDVDCDVLVMVIKGHPLMMSTRKSGFLPSPPSPVYMRPPSPLWTSTCRGHEFKFNFQVQFFLFGIVYEKQNVQTLKQARLTSSKTKGNNKMISRLYHAQACRSFP